MKVKGITGELADILRATKPGQVQQLTLDDGAEFVVLHRDDFEHVAGLAGLGMKETADQTGAMHGPQ